MGSLQSTLETEDHFLRAEHIDTINVTPHQGPSTHKSAPPLKGTHPYSCSEGDPTQWHAKNRYENILFKDEKIFTIEEQYNNQNNKIYAQTSCEVKKNIPRVQGGHLPSYVTVWWEVSHQGVTHLHFCKKGVKLVPKCIKRACYKEL